MAPPPPATRTKCGPPTAIFTIPLLADRVPRFYERTRDGTLSRISKVRPLASEDGNAVCTLNIVRVGGGRPEAYLVEQRSGQVLPACQESQPRPTSPAARYSVACHFYTIHVPRANKLSIRIGTELASIVVIRGQKNSGTQHPSQIRWSLNNSFPCIFLTRS